MFKRKRKQKPMKVIDLGTAKEIHNFANVVYNPNIKHSNWKKFSKAVRLGLLSKQSISYMDFGIYQNANGRWVLKRFDIDDEYRLMSTTRHGSFDTKKKALSYMLKEARKEVILE